jgi:hypothetical protein
VRATSAKFVAKLGGSSGTRSARPGHIRPNVRPGIVAMRNAPDCPSPLHAAPPTLPTPAPALFHSVIKIPGRAQGPPAPLKEGIDNEESGRAPHSAWIRAPQLPYRKSLLHLRASFTVRCGRLDVRPFALNSLHRGLQASLSMPSPLF